MNENNPRRVFCASIVCSEIYCYVKKKFRNFAILFISFFLVMLVFFPGRYMTAVSDGLLLFVLSVLPAMLPFFFFSRLLTSLDVASTLSNALDKPVRKLFNAPGVGGYILAMSMLSGYPIGAKLISDCVETGICTQDEAKRLLSFTSTSGPLFILGTVGINMLGNYKAGAVILLCHYLGALANGLLFRGKTVPENGGGKLVPLRADNLLSEAINGSIAAVLAVGGYIAIFNMVIMIFQDIKVIPFIAETLSRLGFSYGLCEGSLTGLLEITRGSYILATSGQGLRKTIPVLAGIISFGGLSVTVQSLTFLTSAGVKAGYYFLVKISQAVLTYAIAVGASMLIF